MKKQTADKITLAMDKYWYHNLHGMSKFDWRGFKDFINSLVSEDEVAK